jgi:putative FmdB family regulatory protein
VTAADGHNWQSGALSANERVDERRNMPTYVYACTDPECAHRFEAVQAFTDDALTECPVCGHRLRKVFGSIGVVFKGSGFYRNDSRAGAAKSESVETSSSESSNAAAAKDSGGKDAAAASSGAAAAASTPASSAPESSGSKPKPAASQASRDTGGRPASTGSPASGPSSRKPAAASKSR